MLMQKFREYILGKTTVVQADHKTLETILRKPMATAPLITSNDAESKRL